MMDSETHQRFVQQLCHWAGNYIAQGRSPFRKAEPGLALHTSQGQQQPDMILWINQDSFVAGGFIHIPSGEAEDLSIPCACAEALGVNYFATWGTRNLTIWQADSKTVTEQWPIPDLNDNSPKAYEMLLVQLMDEFRTLAVLGACPPEKLSHWHLTNLCLSTLHKARPLLSEHLRRTRSDKIRSLDAAEDEANSKLNLTIARMLVLLHDNKLPYSIEPENLDKALIQWSRELKINQLDQLADNPEEIELDEQSQVLLHHLLRRLDQIGLFRAPARAAKLLEQLLQHTAAVDDSAVPPPDTVATALLYSNQFAAHWAPSIDIDVPQRLAFKYLLRQLQQWPQPQQCRSQLFSLPLDSALIAVAGQLLDRQTPQTHYRNTWSNQINATWSGQRMHLPRHTPNWVYQLVYALGRLAPEGHAELTVPAELLYPVWSTPLLALLEGHYTFASISVQDNLLHLSLSRQTDSDKIVALASPLREVQISNSELHHFGAIRLALILRAPEELYRLIEEKRLHPATDDNDHPGLERYHRSSLAEQLSQLLEEAATSGKTARLIPLPATSILDSLAALDLDGLSASQQRDLIDTILEQRLDVALPSDLASPQSVAASQAAVINKKSIEDTIYHALEIAGIPTFPEHYLYDFFRPELRSFATAHPPWQIDSEFLGTFTLKDAGGHTCHADNDYQAYAVALARASLTALSLPTDSAICQQIVERYLLDLVRIHQLIWHECHAALPTTTTANRLGNKIWKTLQLPPYKLVEEAIARFRLDSSD
jgi:hypothetical protein